MRLIIAYFLFSWSLLATNTVTLAWDPNPEPVTGYRLLVGTISRAYTVSNEVLAPTTMATVTNIVAGQRYFFAVMAFNAYGESEPSDEVSCMFPIPPPKGLRIITALQSSFSVQGPWETLWAQETPMLASQPETFYRAHVTIIPE